MNVQYCRTCGGAPVQYEGTITNGHGAAVSFYFRARWDSWRMSIAPTLDEAIGGGERALYESEGAYENASWMPFDEAETRIVNTAAQFLAQRENNAAALGGDRGA